MEILYSECQSANAYVYINPWRLAVNCMHDDLEISIKTHQGSENCIFCL